MNSSRVLATPSPTSSNLSSPSLFPRPLFASDIAAKKSGSSFKGPSFPSPTIDPHRQGTHHHKPPSSSSMMDLSSKLSELPAFHLPDFHLPDLHRLKQQLNKHAPSFSLKSLQHTFHTPSPTSSSATSTNSSTSKGRHSLSLSRSSRSSSAGQHSSDSGASSHPSPTHASQPSPQSNTRLHGVGADVACASPDRTLPHPSSYLIKKPTAPVNIPTPNNKHNPLPTPATTTTTLPGLMPEERPTSTTTPDPTKFPAGHLYLQIIEARNLSLVNPPALSRPFCLVEYDQNELMTPPAQPEAATMGRRLGNDVFAQAMAASNPKWRHDVEFDVVRPNKQISVTIYDSGVDDNQDQRFLGQVKLKLTKVHDQMIDSWFRLQGREDGHEVTGEIRITIKYQAVEPRHLSASDFDILRVLGVGSFGKVYQVRKRDTGRIYAMKVLNKKQIIEQKQVEHTIAERNVLIQALQSPFIVGLKFSFQTATKLYLVQDFMNGGELFFHMQNEGTFSEPTARFYTAELVLALEHLHSCNVVYRDLKPENVLLSAQGHLVLVDFGLCKQNVTEESRTNTFCGTTEYLAPEIVKGTKYGKAVDWWSLGVLLYEMLIGSSPFANNSTEDTYHKILHQPVIFPSQVGRKGSSYGISADARDLIQRLLDKNPKTRLGSGPNSAEAAAAIKAHPFFSGLDFVKLATRDVTPPFKPHVGVMGDLDVSNFDTHFTDQNAALGKGIGKTKKMPHGPGGGGLPKSGQLDGETGSFLLQQQQKAANLYRQQQNGGGNTQLNPNVSRGRRSSNSWCSYRTLSTDSLFTISEPGSPSVTRGGVAIGGKECPPLAAYRARARQQQIQQQQQQNSHREYFKGFTFEGESILDTIQQRDEQEEGGELAKGRNQLFSGKAGSVDSIFGSP